MDLCEKLHDDANVRALLWCLIGSDDLNVATLKECGMNDSEAQAIIRDQPGLLRRLRMRHATAIRITVQDLASLLRNKLSEQIENTKKATELASILRCLKGLPSWLYPEWEKAEVAEEINQLLNMTNGAHAS